MNTGMQYILYEKIPQTNLSNEVSSLTVQVISSLEKHVHFLIFMIGFSQQDTNPMTPYYGYGIVERSIFYKKKPCGHAVGVP